MISLGCHLSAAAGYEKVGNTAVSIGANTFQFFTRNPRGGSARAIDPQDVEKLAEILSTHQFAPILAHAPYTLNMASDTQKTREFAEMVFADDLDRLAQLPCKLYNFHPGSHTGIGAWKGIQNIVEILNRTVTEPEGCTILLETMSGKGTEIGKTFEEIREIIDGTKVPERFGVCLDTCHLFAAGYDIVNHLDDVVEELDRVIGLPLVRAVHLNDSMTPFDSRKDRHAGFGKGEIGGEALLRVITHPALCKLPFYLETPYDEDGHKQEIQMIRELVAERI